jgi:hypothetical protein
VLLLLPEGRRSAAVRALAAGADAYVLHPAHAPELASVASALVRGAAVGGAGGATVQLAGEVAHAVNNPLQVLSLLGEGGSLPESVARGLRETVDRIGEVVEVLAAYGRLGPPHRTGVDLARSMDRALEQAAVRGRVRRAGASPGAVSGSAPEVQADAEQLDAAFDAAIRFLAARSRGDAPRVSGRVRAGAGARRTEAALRAEGIHLSDGEAEEAIAAVLMNDPETRRSHPGLALPAAVCRAHGGGLTVRPANGGSILVLALG